MERLGTRIYNERKKRRITLREMAEDTGLSAMYISEIENGKKLPLKSEALPKIAVYLEMDPAELTRLAFLEKGEARSSAVASDLSLAVARQAMTTHDTEMLQMVMKIFRGEEIK